MTNSTSTASTARENTAKVDITGYRESCRLYFDFFKHLTTLRTGSILLLVTFLTNGLESVKANKLVFSSLLLFFLSIMASAGCMFIFASHVQGKRNRQLINQNLIAVGALIAAGTFLGGIASFILYAYRSFS